MSDELLVVQFPHPGGEHGPDRPGFKGWNLGGHRRKFMKARGHWRTSPTLDAPDHTGDVIFWGEWEPPSRVVELAERLSGCPRFLHEPHWASPPLDSGAQNTDPYVFGDRFRYSNCRQNTRKGPLRTQRLAAGSVILFGSGLGGEFVLDTVFVIDDAQHLNGQTVKGLRESDEVFAATTLDLLFPREGEESFRLYTGATPQAPVAGMFSFFPCLPFEEPPRGFPRPVVRLDRVISPRNWRAAKMTRLDSLDDAFRIWRQVVNQVLDQDLALGVRALAPPPLGVANTAAGC